MSVDHEKSEAMDLLCHHVPSQRASLLSNHPSRRFITPSTFPPPFPPLQKVKLADFGLSTKAAILRRGHPRAALRTLQRLRTTASTSTAAAPSTPGPSLPPWSSRESAAPWRCAATRRREGASVWTSSAASPRSSTAPWIPPHASNLTGCIGLAPPAAVLLPFQGLYRVCMHQIAPGG